MYTEERPQIEIIAENLQRLLRKKGMSQNQLAHKIDVSAQLGHSSIDITLRTYTHLFTDATTASKHISDVMEGIVAPNGHQNKEKTAET